MVLCSFQVLPVSTEPPARKSRSPVLRVRTCTLVYPHLVLWFSSSGGFFGVALFCFLTLLSIKELTKKKQHRGGVVPPNSILNLSYSFLEDTRNKVSAGLCYLTSKYLQEGVMG